MIYKARSVVCECVSPNVCDGILRVAEDLRNGTKHESERELNAFDRCRIQSKTEADVRHKANQKLVSHFDVKK